VRGLFQIVQGVNLGGGGHGKGWGGGEEEGRSGVRGKNMGGGPLPEKGVLGKWRRKKDFRQ